MTDEWVVYRRLVDGLLDREPKSAWDEYEKLHSNDVKAFELIADGLTEEQAHAMMRLSRSGE